MAQPVGIDARFVDVFDLPVLSKNAMAGRIKAFFAEQGVPLDARRYAAITRAVTRLRGITEADLNFLLGRARQTPGVFLKALGHVGRPMIEMPVLPSEVLLDIYAYLQD